MLETLASDPCPPALSHAEPTDDLLTLGAIGAVAYVAETLVHEAVGHGGVCLASGYRITAIAPLWMHCSVATPIVNLAGPAANLAMALICWLILQLAPPRSNTVRMFVWLSLAFNALVAAGYMGVGGATGFGDWPAVLGSLAPFWLERLSLIAMAVAIYVGFLRLAGAALLREVGIGALSDRRLRRLALAPAFGAALVAIGAEAFGEGAKPLGLALALGSTLVVGLTLTSLPTHGAEADKRPTPHTFRVRFSLVWIVLALAVAGSFVFAVGPGYDVAGMDAR